LAGKNKMAANLTYLSVFAIVFNSMGQFQSFWHQTDISNVYYMHINIKTSWLPKQMAATLT